MEGVILYADDHIHSVDRMEYKLFNELRSELPVLGVDNLDLASSAVKSIGSFGAVILDWQFTPDKIPAVAGDDSSDEDEALIQAPSTKEHATMRFLMDHNFYSLIYIFSEKDIEELHGVELRNKYGERIKIKKKSDVSSLNASELKNVILSDIRDWKSSNKSLSVPIQWSVAINKSMQSIFRDLADADADWIKELYKSSKDDGVAPEVFLIEILQLLLMEELVQNNPLIESLRTEGSGEDTSVPDENAKRKSLSKLFSRLYYSKLTDEAPVMTGDIFELSESQYGILVTPECDVEEISRNKNRFFDLLEFSTTSMEESFKPTEIKSRKKSIFNQPMARLHFLPSLPFLSQEYNKGCTIDFSTGAIKITSEELLKRRKEYKLNSPFIQSLRQRYLSHLGRVGTPRVHQLVTMNHWEPYSSTTTDQSPAPATKNGK